MQGPPDDAASVASEARTPSKAMVVGSRGDMDLRSSNAALQHEVAQYRMALTALQGQQDSVDSRSTVAETTKDVTNKVSQACSPYVFHDGWHMRLTMDLHMTDTHSCDTLLLLDKM